MLALFFMEIPRSHEMNQKLPTCCPSWPVNNCYGTKASVCVCVYINTSCFTKSTTSRYSEGVGGAATDTRWWGIQIKQLNHQGHLGH